MNFSVQTAGQADNAAVCVDAENTWPLIKQPVECVPVDTCINKRKSLAVNLGFNITTSLRIMPGHWSSSL
jgi:hypothetical protein